MPFQRLKSLFRSAFAPGRRRGSSQPAFALLTPRPPVFYCIHWWNEEEVRDALRPLFVHLRNRRAYFLFNWWWNAEHPERIEQVRRLEQDHRRRYPDQRFIHLCNSRRQEELFAAGDLRAVFCNQNALVDERIFKPLEGIEKKYDAVYDARLKDYKRHELASRIESLALIYAFEPHVDDAAFVEQTKVKLAHAHFFNHTGASTAEHTTLAPAEVNECLATCRVGLCLSAEEGAMYASIQYMLAGLPVVSTNSRGGRDAFFDDEYVLIVDDDPDAVRDGVLTLIQRNVPPDYIRAKTLEKMQVHRSTLIRLVQEFIDAEGADTDFATDWDDVFAHRLFEWQTPDEALARIDEAFEEG